MNDNWGPFLSRVIFFDHVSVKRKPVFVPGRSFYSLSYRYSGKISILCDDRELISEADTITFVPKGQAYTTEILEDTRMTGIHFEFFGECAPDVPTLPVVLPIKTKMLRSLFESLTENNPSPSAELLRMATLYRILAELRSLSLLDAHKSVPERIRRAEALIREHACDPLCSVEGLADTLGISASYLRREFHLAYGVSPLQYLKDLRIRHAKQLLSGTQSIAEIALLCGYSGASYFIQDFRKITGESPNRYRKRMISTP